MFMRISDFLMMLPSAKLEAPCSQVYTLLRINLSNVYFLFLYLFLNIRITGNIPLGLEAPGHKTQKFGYKL